MTAVVPTTRGPNLLSSPRTLPAHVDVDETVRQFGHDPRLLRPQSAKTVVAWCVECRSVRTKPLRNALRQLRCLACSNAQNARADKSREARSISLRAYYAAGGVHPLKGKGHSEKTKRLLSAVRTGARPRLSVEVRQRKADICNRVLNNPTQIERTRSVTRLRTGPLNPAYGKPPAHACKVWYQKPDGTRVCLRSTWEAAFAAWLDLQGLAWTYEERTYPVVIHSADGPKLGTYTPDFFVGELLYEVKGRWTEIGRAKFDAFRSQYGMHVHVIDREFLKEKQLI